MNSNQDNSYGYIYRATYKQNGKVYIGQTVTERWDKEAIPIEKRWKEEVEEAFQKYKRGEQLRYIEYAIVKYGKEGFQLVEQDNRARTQEELDELETFWIYNFDSLNPKKGYNLKEGGRGGLLSDLAKKNLSKIIEKKWNNDSDYIERHLKERADRSNDKRFLEKMETTNRKIWRDKKSIELVKRNSFKEWEKFDHILNHLRSRWEGRREIGDKKQFLRDFLSLKYKDLLLKYNLTNSMFKRRIKTMFKFAGIKNYTNARFYIKENGVGSVYEEIKKYLKSKPEKRGVKKKIPDIKEFLIDIQTVRKKDICKKYDMGQKTINRKIAELLAHKGVYNYTDARSYLEEKNLNDVLRDIETYRKTLIERARMKAKGFSKIEFLRDIIMISKRKMTIKYDMCAKTVNRKIEEMLGVYGVKKYSEARILIKKIGLNKVIKELGFKA